MQKSVLGAIRGVFFEWQPQNWWKTSYFGPTDMKIKYLRRDFDLPYTRTPLLLSGFAMGVDKEFTLDFTGLSGVPSQWNMTVNKVVQNLEKQSNGIHGIQVVKDRRRRGVFIVTAQSNDAKNFLTNFKLCVEEGQRKFYIPLRETNPEKMYGSKSMTSAGGP